MKFMDLLFKRYASPFLLLDELILSGGLDDFVGYMLEQISNDQEWEFFLHKVFDKTFREFKESLKETEKPRGMTRSDVETTIRDSFNMAENFIPDKGVEV